MSGRAIFARAAPLARRHFLNGTRPVIRRNWALGVNALHQTPVVRPISFVPFGRSIPKLFSKFATAGAFAGGATIAGLVYIQNQATLAGNYVLDIFNKGADGATATAGQIAEGANYTLDRLKRGWQSTTEKIEVPAWM